MFFSSVVRENVTLDYLFFMVFTSFEVSQHCTDRQSAFKLQLINLLLFV